MNLFAEQRFIDFERLMVKGTGGEEGGIGVWNGNVLKLDCDDGYTTINIIH